MGHVIATGGGEIGDGETREIEERVVEAADASHPTVLFVPTASQEPPGYVEKIEQVYGDELGCDVEVLRLLYDPDSEAERERKVQDADVVYVGGGSTRFMMQVWDAYGVDELLREAHADGTVMTGNSSGAICWFQSGFDLSSDAAAELIPSGGLGLYEFDCTCHVERDDFHSLTEAFVQRRAEPTISLTANAAFEIVDDRYRVLTSQPDAEAFVVRDRDGVEWSELERADEFRPLSTLRSGD